MIDVLPRTHTSRFYLVAYLFPLGGGLLISPTATFRALGSKSEHASAPWRLFGGVLFTLGVVVLVQMIWKHQSALYVITVIVRLLFVALFSYLAGKTKNRAYFVILAVLGFGLLWTTIALELDLREEFPIVR